jgi:hypothetical protein
MHYKRSAFCLASRLSSFQSKLCMHSFTFLMNISFEFLLGAARAPDCEFPAGICYLGIALDFDVFVLLCFIKLLNFYSIYVANLLILSTKN